VRVTENQWVQANSVMAFTGQIRRSHHGAKVVTADGEQAGST